MELHFSEKLKDLRLRCGDIQEKLAAFLGVSAQAVSKWERGESYPDITLLPRIAGYYHVTVDELLGVDEIAKQQRIDEITARYNEIRHHVPLDPDYHLDEGIELIREALRELPGVFFFEQLLAADLSRKAKHCGGEERQAAFDEALVLCRDILERSTEQRWRGCACEILLVIYAELGMTEQALELAYQMAGPFTTCEYMLTYILQGEELTERYRLNAVLYYRVFAESVRRLAEAGADAADMPHPHELKVHGIDGGEYMRAIENVLTQER